MTSPRRADAIFFLSGAAALVYQVVWMRLLVRHLGSETAAVGVVLAVFMSGLGAGAWIAGESARRLPDARRVFAGLGLFTALWAAASPLLLDRLPVVGSLAGRALLAAAVLLPPTLAMGATFPVMSVLSAARGAALGSRVAAFYGANTLGAAAGALLAPFLLMPRFGLSGALWAGAGLDALAALGVLFLAAPRPAGDAPHDAAAGTPAGPAPRRLLAVTALLGAVGLGLEVQLTRMLVSLTGASVYAFALVLFAFLVGLGLGARQAQSWLRFGAERVLFRCALWLPAATAIGLVVLRLRLDGVDLFGALENLQSPSSEVALLWFGHGLLATLVLLPPTAALGAALPAAAAVLASRRSDPERWLGRLYAANTAGATVGSLVTAFWLLPHLGPFATLAGLLAAALAGAALLGRRSAEALPRSTGADAPPRSTGADASPRSTGADASPRSTGAEPLLAVLLAALAFVLLGRGSESGSGARTVALAHGLDSTAAVQVDDSGPGHRLLRINGKVVASSAPVDLRLQRLLAHVPAQLHGGVGDALVIGLGTGMTAGALLDFESLEALRIVELSDAVVEVAPHFSDLNGDVLRDPRAELILGDGRHRLRLDARRYDLITADPIHPWTRGSSDLYSLEHFQSLAEHLRPGGIASQWLPLYQLSDADVRVVVATWTRAFPHTSAWLTAYDLVLVGSTEPHPGPAELARSVLPPRAAASLARAGVHGSTGLAALRVADDARLRALAAGASPMTEERPVLEFSAPTSYLAGYSTETLRWSAAPASLAGVPAELREHALAVRACLERFLEALPSGWSAAADRYGSELLSLPPPPSEPL